MSRPYPEKYICVRSQGISGVNAHDHDQLVAHLKDQIKWLKEANKVAQKENTELRINKSKLYVITDITKDSVFTRNLYNGFENFHHIDRFPETIKPGNIMTRADNFGNFRFWRFKEEKEEKK